MFSCLKPVMLVWLLNQGDSRFQLSGDVKGMLIYNGGPVCFNQFSDNAATAVCNEMGYQDGTYEKEKKKRIGWSLGSFVSCNSFSISCNGTSWRSCSAVENKNRQCGHGEWYVILSCSNNKVTQCNYSSDDSSSDTCNCTVNDKPVGSAILICFSVTMVLICSILSLCLVKERRKTKHKMDIPTRIYFENQHGEPAKEKNEIRKHTKGIPSGYDDLVIKVTSENGSEEEEYIESKDDRTYEDLVISQTKITGVESKKVEAQTSPTENEREELYKEEAHYDEVLVVPDFGTGYDDRKYSVLGERISTNLSGNDAEDGTYSKLNNY
ncbi:hypothetical protein ACHWQZ_G012408 [Mnemiopsis leidyi]